MTTEQLHTISIPGLPDGWCGVAYRLPKIGEYFLFHGLVETAECDYDENEYIILEKIQPRRIVLEETEEDTDPLLYQPIKIDGLCVLMVMHNKIWRVVEEEEK